MTHTQQDNIIRAICLIICLICLLLAILPAIARANVFNDAYSYQDDFENANGLNLAESAGITVSGNAIVAEAATAVAVSQCITLPQPESGTFLGWQFLDVSFADLAAGANTLEIQNCSGGTLRTIPNLPNGDSSIDLSGLSAPTIRLEWRPGQAGARLTSWKVVGRAAGVTTIAVVPDTLTPDAGDTITFTINLESSGAITRNPVLRFSLDDINGLHTPDVDDGLAEDAEVDYGSGVNTYRPLEFVSASNGPNGEAPTTPEPGATEGEIVWELDDLSDKLCR